MAMVWTQNLSVGVDLIDGQHKILFDKVNALFDACNQRKGDAYIAPLLKFLSDYTHSHFSDEERYMQSINYPRLPIQKELHAKFIQQLAKIKSEYESSGGNVVVIITASQLVTDWLIAHVSVEDKKIGEYAKQIGK